jgi:hypothetical protein
VTGTERWWDRIEWVDVVLLAIAVIVLLSLTMDIWLPHLGID